MLPRVDVGEAILEVMGWVPEFLGSLTALSGGAGRMAGLVVTVAACLTSQALNIGYGPVAEEGVAALQRRRLGHVGRTYLRAANYTAANPHLIAKQAGIGFAQALGGGLVAAIDGMRFVVPVPSLFAKPNRKYFGPKRGMTWLNAINDQAFAYWTAHKIVAGPTETRLPPRDRPVLQLRCRRPSRGAHHRYRIVLGPGIRDRATAGRGLSHGVG